MSSALISSSPQSLDFSQDLLMKPSRTMSQSQCPILEPPKEQGLLIWVKRFSFLLYLWFTRTNLYLFNIIQNYIIWTSKSVRMGSNKCHGLKNDIKRWTVNEPMSSRQPFKILIKNFYRHAIIAIIIIHF